MKFFKKILVLAFALALVFSVGCGGSQSDGSQGLNGPNGAMGKSFTFVAPDGAPALSIAKFIDGGETFGMNAAFDYKVVSSSQIASFMQRGSADFMIMPINAASKLYKTHSSDPYKMVGVVTHGNLYIMSSDGTNSLEGLKGKVVGVIGQGLVPDLTLKAVLSDNGLLGDVLVGDTATEGKITLKYFSDASNMLPMLIKTDNLSVGLLPEPAATKLTSMASDKEWTRLDLQQLYDSEKKAYPQAVLMVKSSVYSEYKTQIDAIKSYFDENSAWIKQNPDKAVSAVNGALEEGVTPSLVAANITSEVIDNCKIYFENSDSAKQSVITYLNKIITIEAQAAKVPADDFFA